MKNVNKIIIDEKEISLESFEGILEISEEICTIHLNKENKITDLFIPSSSSVTFELEDDASLYFHNYWNGKNNEANITIKSKNNTILDWNLFIETKENYNLVLNNEVIGNNNRNKIKVNTIALNDKTCTIKTIGKIDTLTENNEFLEELKGLALEKESIIFKPELTVDSNFVTANHNATIRCINEEELFYLKSKGIKEEVAINLIKEGFLNKLN